jgi:phosphoribosylamine--glycine ligase
MRFVLVTKWFTGLGFALRLQEEGHDVVVAVVGIDDQRKQASYALVGAGLVDRRPLAELMAERAGWRDAYWIWDENHAADENEALRREGFRVLGGGAYADAMEHDRAYCLRFVGEHGLEAPPSHRFETPNDALAFVEARPRTAYVFKPDEGENFETWLPESDKAAEANRELRAHLKSLKSTTPFILQERKDGVETNVEVWFVDGEPRFAFMCLESKRKLAGDLGDLVGCAFDFAFVIPLDSRAVRESVGRMFETYRKMRYTGFGDANFIAARDGVWFFEKCERFGYNAHPNLLWNLNLAPLGTTLASLLDGTFAPRFSPGFGASVSLYMDHPRPGKAVGVPAGAEGQLYWYDVYREDGLLLTAGYADNVAIAAGFGYTIPTAWEACLAVARGVTFPGRAFRIDGAGTDFPSSPLRRYEALVAMDYV